MIRNYWYIWYRVNGGQIRESTCNLAEGCSGKPKMETEALLQRRLGEAGLGIRPAQEVKGLKYGDLRDALIAHYEIEGTKNGRRSGLIEEGTEPVYETV